MYVVSPVYFKTTHVSAAVQTAALGKEERRQRKQSEDLLGSGLEYHMKRRRKEPNNRHVTVNDQRG